MGGLVSKRCAPCERGTAPLGCGEAGRLLDEVHEWELNSECSVIMRTFRFRNYYETIAFVNSLAWIAHHEDHHPDLNVSYNRCTVQFSTHAIGGLSENDFICAAKIDALLPAENTRS